MVFLDQGSIEPELLVYVNRLSDLLFVMARAVNQRAAVPELEW
jgi:cob(I)alamin adenosyltransferase